MGGLAELRPNAPVLSLLLPNFLFFHLIVEADHKSKINHHGVSASSSILATEETCSQKESAPLWFYNFTFCDARTFPKRCHLVFLTFWGLYICLNIWFHL